MKTVPLDSFVPVSVLLDAQRAIDGFRSNRQAVRVCRVHVEDYMRLLERVESSKMLEPFVPTICGVPVEPWERAEFGVFAVADDDTPLTACGGIVREEIN